MVTLLGNIMTACITGGLALLGVVITNINSNKSIENKLITAQAVTDEKIDNLTKSIDRHTSSIEKVPVLEHRLDEMEKRTDKIEERLSLLSVKKQ